MRPVTKILLLLASVSFAARAAEVTSPTVPLKIHRAPADLVKQGGLEPDEERTLSAVQGSCEGTLAVRALGASLEIHTSGSTIAISHHGEVTVEKLKEGPLAAPLLEVTTRGESGVEKHSFVLETMMTSPAWEKGGVFRETFSGEKLVDAKFWQSVELRCTETSPYRAALIPPGVTYKHGDDAAIAETARALRQALGSIRGLGTPALYSDEMVIVGPELYAAIRKDEDLAGIKSPKIVTIDPDTKTQRSELRAKGAAELLLLGQVMSRYLPAMTPRIRAATAVELARHWKNIGWDIEEPLLVADYGSHRLIFEYAAGGIMMVDELPPPAK